VRGDNGAFNTSGQLRRLHLQPVSQHPSRNREWWWAIAATVAVVALGVGAWWWTQQTPPVEVRPAPASGPVTSAASPGASSAAILHPIAPAQPPDASLDLAAQFARLVPTTALLGLLRLDDFEHRFVATVDNLGRAHAPSRLWPVEPARGRIMVRDGDGVSVIDEANASRYAEHLRLLETLDPALAASLYVQLYPRLQAAYQRLGYPNGYFNDRLVEVIDQLLATPVPKGAVPVVGARVVSPDGIVQPSRLYEFDDPALEGLSAGQKVLLRIGPDGERRIKARLAEFRRLVTRDQSPR